MLVGQTVSSHHNFAIVFLLPKVRALICHSRTSGPCSSMPPSAWQKYTAISMFLPVCPPLSGNCPVHWPYRRLSCCSWELLIHFWPFPFLLPSDVPVLIAKFSLSLFPLSLCKVRHCLLALSLSFLSINFIFICYLQSLEKRSEACTFPGMCPLSSQMCPLAPILSPLLLSLILWHLHIASSGGSWWLKSSHHIFTLHQSSLICASRHLALSALWVLFLKVSPLLFWL